MSITLIEIIMNDLREYDIDLRNRRKLLSDTDKVINILNLLVERFKALKLQLLSDNETISSLPIKTVDNSILQKLMLLLNAIQSTKQIAIDNSPESEEREIIVQDNITMRTIIKIIDSLSHQKL